MTSFLLLFFCLFICSSKNIFLLNPSFYLEWSNLSLISISMLLLIMMISGSLFSANTTLDCFLMISMSAVVLLCMLFFMCFDGFYLVVLLEMTVILMFILIFNLSKDQDKISSFTFMFFLNMLGSIPFMLFIGFSTSKSISPFNVSYNFYSLNSFLFFFFFFLYVDFQIAYFLASFLAH